MRYLAKFKNWGIEALVKAQANLESRKDYQLANDKEAFKLALQQAIIQASTDAEADVVSVVEAQELKGNPETESGLTQQTQKEGKMKNVLNVQGRFSVAKTAKEANRLAIIRFMGDAIQLATIGQHIVNLSNLDRKGRYGYTGKMNNEESFLVAGALTKWFAKQESTQVFKSYGVVALLEMYMEKVNSGDISLEKGNLDLRIPELYSVYAEKALPFFVGLKQGKAQPAMNASKMQTYVHVMGSALTVRYLSKGEVANRVAVVTNGLVKEAEVVITAETFSDKGLQRLAQVVVSKGNGQYGQFWTEGTKSIAAPRTYEIMGDAGWMPAMDVLVLSTLAKMDVGTLEARPGTHFGVALTEDGVAAVSPLKGKAYEGCFGVTKSKNILLGYANSFKQSESWLYVNEEGNLVTSEKVLSKAVARILKLDVSEIVKNQTRLNNLFLVTGVPAGNPEPVVRALCTGVIWTLADDLIRNGQQRVVSDASRLGLKGTLAPIAFISPDLEKRNIGLVGFGSAKAGAYGIKTMGLTKTQIQTVVLGEEVTLEGYMVEEVIVRATNFYSVNEYQPASIETLAASWAESAGVNLDKVLDKVAQDKATEEGSVFLASVKAYAKENGVGIPQALELMEEEGIIARKGDRTTFTSTEFDVLAVHYGWDKAIELVDELIDSPLNKNKGAEMNWMLDLVENRPLKEDRIIRWNIEQVAEMAVVACKMAGVSPSNLGSKAPNRSMLVNFVDMLYGVNEAKPNLDYVVIQGELIETVEDDYGNTTEAFVAEEVAIPVGKFLEGSTFKSSVFLESVVMSGFLTRLLPALTFATNVLAKEDGRLPTRKQYASVMRSLANEVEANICGKDLGRLKATGCYHVLSVAPWADALDVVYAPNAGRFGRDGSEVFITKHPVVMQDSHTAATLTTNREFFKGLVQDSLTDERLDLVLKALGNTVFVHPDMLLAVQNDSDGDTVRLTTHKTCFEHFKANGYKPESNVISEFHKAYRESERELFGKDEKTGKEMEVNAKELLEACLQEGEGKDLVSKYTAGMQRFMQAFGGKEPKVKHYREKVIVLGLFVQELAMNAIKHKVHNGITAAEWFYAPLPREKEDIKAHVEAAMESYVAFMTSVGADALTLRFGEELFWELHRARAGVRPSHITALSKDRIGLEVEDTSIKGLGINLGTGSVMDYIVAKFL